MSRTFRGNSSGRTQNAYFQSTEDGTESSARLPSDYSPPIQVVGGVHRETLFSELIDYQLTVRPKVELNRYQVSMLLEVACWEALKGGIDFIGWLTIEYMTSRLLGSKKIWELREKNERRVCTLSSMILLSSQNTWMNLIDKTSLPQSLLTYIKDSNLISSDRTLFSRKEFWYPSKFLEVKTVRLDVFLEREKESHRYSSYTKGYGESSRMGRRQKTRPSFELDGEETDRPEVVILSDLQNLLYLNLLEIKRKLNQKEA